MQSVNLEEPMQKKRIDNMQKQDEEILKMSEIIDNSDINEEDKERIHAYMEEFQGSLPPPRIMAQYDKVHEGFASDIMGMALKEQEHRHEMERRMVQSETSLNEGQLEIVRASIKLKMRLQIFGFIITILLAVVGSACLFFDKNVESVSVFIMAIASFCWTMFYGKKTAHKEQKGEDSTKS